ncbi:MAG: hypothetical protein ACW98Y_19635, partial [Candidatus Thorarchaeota archaeon]
MTEQYDAIPSTDIADAVIMAQDLKSLSEVFEKMTTSDVVSDEKLRTALKYRAFEIITLSRQNRIEGRSLDTLRWIVSYPEFLLENSVQEEIRLSGLGRDLFHDFANILDAEHRSIVEYKEVLRAIGTIPGIGDIAWEELHQSPLKGLASAIESEEGIARLLALVLRIGTLLYNRSILDAVNSRADEIIKALEGRRNPDLARNLIGALAALPSSPWPVKDPSKPKRGKLDSKILDTVLLRIIKNIPEVNDISEMLVESPKKFRTVLERAIDRVGWPFVRAYLLHIAELRGERSSLMQSIAETMRPLGSINVAFLLSLISKEIPIPRQIIQTALGSPDEYVLSHDALEQDKIVNSFRSDGLELETSVEALRIQGHHLENARTGIRLTEAIVGKSSLIRLLVDMKTDQSLDIAT